MENLPFDLIFNSALVAVVFIAVLIVLMFGFNALQDFNDRLCLRAFKKRLRK